jgi:hypothetical protein
MARTTRRAQSSRTPESISTGTMMAGAIVGGTIGAFTGGPIVTIAGMAVGALAAHAITRYFHHESNVPTNRHTPAS